MHHARAVGIPISSVQACVGTNERDERAACRAGRGCHGVPDRKAPVTSSADMAWPTRPPAGRTRRLGDADAVASITLALASK